MRLPYLLSFVWFIPKLIFCGYPISDPYDETVPIKTLPYNLIDTNPTCFWNGVCPMFYPGGKLGVFPNSEERFQHILHNMHRLFLNQSTDITLGYLFYGTGGDKSSFARGDYCGKYVRDRHPLYWYSDANQLARWKQYDENTCDQTWYGQGSNTNHVTCKWGTNSLSFSYKNNQYSLPEDRCSLFSDDCGYGMRAAAFCRDFGNEDRDRCMFESEGICGGNSCLSSSVHCDPIFADKYDYVGKGFVAGMNGACSVYSRYTKQIWYQLPIGAHFDERMKIPSDMRREDGKHFGLWLEYHDINKTQKANACYALYDGQLTEMSVLVSRFPFDGGQYKKGSYSSQSYKALFLDYFAPPTSGCEPYAFICRTSSGNIFRLPEDSDYYFGTEWIDWKWSDYNGNYGLMCKENHYYYDAAEGWTVNGGPTLTQSDIWFYQENNQCVGCQKIEILDCLSQCIYNSAGAPSQICQDNCRFTAAPTATTKAPTQNPTSKPTNLPTKDPSQTPTNDPTQTPTENPSKKPSELPTKTPSANPSTSPTTKPTVFPSNKPTKNPNTLPTVSPLTASPTNTPSINPTQKPATSSPTASPSTVPQTTTYSTTNPTNSPSINPSQNPVPTKKPTPNPTEKPTPNPTNKPTPKPSANPTRKPTKNPTMAPTPSPSPAPSSNPTPAPTSNPTPFPTIVPTFSPTFSPTEIPTRSPTNFGETLSPTKSPTPAPSLSPTESTENPTPSPTTNPTSAPTFSPTSSPTIAPTPVTSTSSPTNTPSTSSTIFTTYNPTVNPLANPTCNIINYKAQFFDITSYDKSTEEAAYVEKARRLFINDTSHCGDYMESEPSLEFFYRSSFRSVTKKVVVFMHICCGKGKRFSSTYRVPANITGHDKYKANAAWIIHNDVDTKEYENKWTDLRHFGLVQYIVYSASGMLFICSGMLFICSVVKRCKKKKKVMVHEPDATNMELAQTIQMYGTYGMPLPGAQNVISDESEEDALKATNIKLLGYNTATNVVPVDDELAQLDL